MHMHSLAVTHSDRVIALLNPMILPLALVIVKHGGSFEPPFQLDDDCPEFAVD